MARPSDKTGRLARYAVIAAGVVLVAWAANIAAVVVLPIVASLLLCVMFWPVRMWMSRWVPGWVAAVACCGAMIVTAVAFVGLASYATVSAAEQFLESKEKYVEQYEGLRDSLTNIGMPVDVLPKLNREQIQANEQRLLGVETRRKITMLVTGGLRSAAGIAAALLLTILLAFLAMLEGERWARWARENLSRKLSDALYEFTVDVSSLTRWYFLGKTIAGLVSGGATWLWLMSMDVPMAAVWGMFTFFMNFIPNVGALISGAPPTLIAIVELGWGGGLAVGAGLIVIETLVGNVLEPFVQGSMMELTAFVVLASLIFWGWLWGIAGAVMAPVLTAAIIAAVRSFVSANGGGSSAAGEGEIVVPIEARSGMDSREQE